MDIFSLLSYINKVSLLAFFVTTLVVGYQIYVLKKEKTKEQAPSIPDFKDKVRSNAVVNYTRLSDSLIKKNNEQANYSKLILFIISLLTIIVVIFVFILIKQNSSLRNEASVSPTTTPTIKPIITLSPSPTCTGQACLTRTKAPTVRPTVTLSASPTEIVLAKVPTLTPTASILNLSPTQSPLKTLPETGSIGKGLLIIGVAVSTIFFSFWF